MAPLNEEDDEDEDSTVFDVKYRYGWKALWLGWALVSEDSSFVLCWAGLAERRQLQTPFQFDKALSLYSPP